MGHGAFERLEDSEGAIAPQLSPDGRRVAYVRQGELQVQDTAGGGGPVRTLTEGSGLGNH